MLGDVIENGYATGLMRAGAMRMRGVSDEQWDALVGTIRDLGRATPADLGLRADGTSYETTAGQAEQVATRGFIRRMAACLLPDQDDTVEAMARQVIGIIYPGRGEGLLTVGHVREVLGAPGHVEELWNMRAAARLLRAGVARDRVVAQLGCSRHLVDGVATFLGIASWKATAVEEAVETALVEGMTAAEAAAHFADVWPDLAGPSERAWQRLLLHARLADEAYGSGIDAGSFAAALPGRITVAMSADLLAQAGRRARIDYRATA